MLTGEIRNQVDAVWDTIWTGGVSNPLEAIEQLTYLLFMKRLDEIHTREERKANRLGIAMENRIFPEGNDDKGRPFEDLRWSRLKNFSPSEMFEVMENHAFPFLKQGSLPLHF